MPRCMMMTKEELKGGDGGVDRDNFGKKIAEGGMVGRNYPQWEESGEMVARLDYYTVNM
jgi:hypothetical protein